MLTPGHLRNPICLRRGRSQRRSLHGVRADVVADSLKPLQNGLPLRPIQLAQERPEALNERVLENRLSVRFRNEEPIQAHAQSFGDLLKRAEAGCHLAALYTREIRARNTRTGLELALRHAAGFPQLTDPLPDVLDRFAIRPVFEELAIVTRQILRRRRRNYKRHLRRQESQTTATITRTRAVLN